MADRHLIDKCLNGDSAAFGMLVDRYKESVYALAYSRLRNFHDAEDITQEAFTKAYQKLRTLRQWDEFYSWIYAITFNLCKDWIKARARRPDREFIEDYPAGLFSFSMQSSDENPTLAVLHEALDSLPESYQQVLTLHYLGDMDCKEMAEFLGKSPSAIWQSLSRARALLKKEMLDMMSETYEQNRLRAGFTFRIVEIVKRIRIDPVPPRTMPWGLSLATGLIIGMLCIGMNVNLTNTESYTSTSSSGQSNVLDIGEFPVDMMPVSNISVTSGQQLSGNGLGTVVPNIQNALFMAPQLEGGTWTKKSDMPTARNLLSTSVVNGKIYAIGGFLGNSTTQAVEEYDPTTDKWIKKSNMPTSRYALTTCEANGKIYAIGGSFAGTTLSTVEEYDPIADKWTRKTNMPTDRFWPASGAVNGKIYVISGLSIRNMANDTIAAVEEYDPKADKWTKKADIPVSGISYACVVNGKIYVLVWEKLLEYDPIEDEWTAKTNMPKGRGFYSVSSLNDKIYAIGGLSNDENELSIVEEYDPATDKWTKKADMPTARYYLSSSAVNERIYAIGGAQGDRFRIGLSGISTVEEYDPGKSQSIEFKGKLPTTWGEVRTASIKRIPKRKSK